MSFNLSAMEFWHEGLVDRISHALDESGIIPDCLNLELTEGILMEDVDMAIQRMESVCRSMISVPAIPVSHI